MSITQSRKRSSEQKDELQRKIRKLEVDLGIKSLALNKRDQKIKKLERQIEKSKATETELADTVEEMFTAWNKILELEHVIKGMTKDMEKKDGLIGMYKTMAKIKEENQKGHFSEVADLKQQLHSLRIELTTNEVVHSALSPSKSKFIANCSSSDISFEKTITLANAPEDIANGLNDNLDVAESGFQISDQTIFLPEWLQISIEPQEELFENRDLASAVESAQGSEFDASLYEEFVPIEEVSLEFNQEENVVYLDTNESQELEEEPMEVINLDEDDSIEIVRKEALAQNDEVMISLEVITLTDEVGLYPERSYSNESQEKEIEVTCQIVTLPEEEEIVEVKDEVEEEEASLPQEEGPEVTFQIIALSEDVAVKKEVELFAENELTQEEEPEITFELVDLSEDVVVKEEENSFTKIYEEEPEVLFQIITVKEEAKEEANEEMEEIDAKLEEIAANNGNDEGCSAEVLTSIEIQENVWEELNFLELRQEMEVSSPNFEDNLDEEIVICPSPRETRETKKECKIEIIITDDEVNTSSFTTGSIKSEEDIKPEDLELPSQFH